MKVQIIRTDGREEEHEVPHDAQLWRRIEELIGAQGTDGVNLRDGRVMFVDDYGYETETVEHPATEDRALVIELRCVKPLKPVNPKATAIYHAVCVPGTTHQIVGDVAIVNDKDFE